MSVCDCYICGKSFLKMFGIDECYQKVRSHCHYTGKYTSVAHSICNLTFDEPNQIPLIFHNGLNYDYHFIIKELANEFERQFDCLRKNKRKYKSFWILTEKEVTNIDNDGNGNGSVIPISSKIKVMDNARLMAS